MSRIVTILEARVENAGDAGGSREMREGVMPGDLRDAADPRDAAPTAGCREDERGFQIQGVPGEICAPKCTAFRPCPSDVPEGATAKPACALKASDGNTYCALLCDPSEEVGTSMLRPPGGMRARGDMCGEATCQSIGGAGICTWSD